MTYPTFRSIDPNERIHIIDSVRGFALLGILLMNILDFGMPSSAIFDLSIRNEYSGLNYYTWWIIMLLSEGCMRGLFSLLFGVSMMLFLSRLSDKIGVDNAAEIYYRRLMWLFLFGLIDSFIILWTGDALHAYSVCGLLLLPFRSAKAKTVLFFFIIIFLYFTILLTYRTREPLRIKQKAIAVMSIDSTKTSWTDEQKSVVKEWKDYKESQKSENRKKEIEKEIKIMKGNYKTIYNYVKDYNIYQSHAINFYWTSHFLDQFLWMILGIILFKLNIITGQRSKKFYAIMAVIGYIITILLGYWYFNVKIASKFDRIKILEQIPFEIYEIRRLAMTLGHLGLFIFLYKTGFFRFIFRTFSKIGQMAFTNYLLQNTLCSVIFFGYGLNYYNELQRYQLYYIVIGIWIINIVLSYIWLHFFRIGPFEWLWRSLTYWKFQPLKLKKNDFSIS